VTPKPVVPRERARLDVEEAVDHYAEAAGQKTTAVFIDALEDAYRHIAAHPSAGSPRYAHELDLPGLRFWRLRRYPYLIFYVEAADHIDVWRVLHGQRDIPMWMRGIDPEGSSEPEI
jgi:toxin ParE1/3/4